MATVTRKKPAGPKKLGDAKAAPKEKKVYTLPTKQTVPSDDLRDYSMLLAGDKKIGKTTLASMFPDTFVMLTEPGGKSLKMFAAPIKGWKDAIGYIEALEADDATGDPRFKYVVVDTADRLANMCEKAVCKRLAIEHPSDEDWGKGYAAVKDEFTTFMNRLLALNKGVILTSHAAEKEFKSKKETITRVVTTLPRWAGEIIEGLVDMWFHYTYDGEDRVLNLRGSENIAAGHRLQHNFQTPNGEELKSIPMGPSSDIGYRNLLDAFSNQYSPSAPPVVAEKKVVKKFKVTR